MNYNKNLEFIKENIKIGFKEFTEYKADFYSSISLTLIDSFITIIFILLFDSLFSTFNLSFVEALFFIFLKQAGLDSFWCFQKGRLRVFKVTTLGIFNSYLTKPINIFLFYMFKGIKVRWIIISLIYFVFLIILIIKYNLNFIHFLFVSIPSIVIFGYLMISIIYFFESLGFFKFEIQGNKIGLFNVSLSSYPPTLYEQFNYKLIFFFFPLVLFGVSTLYYFNRISIEYFATTLLISSFLAILFNVLTYYIWKIGIKRYEAFG